MPPPTPLKISTAALTRLLKEQLSYETELREQEAALERLKGKAKAKAKAAGARVDGEDDRDEGDGNEEFVLRQQGKVIQETRAVFPRLGERIENAVVRVQGEMEAEQEKGLGNSNADEITAAKEVLARAKARNREREREGGSS